MACGGQTAQLYAGVSSIVAANPSHMLSSIEFVGSSDAVGAIIVRTSASIAQLVMPMPTCWTRTILTIMV